MDIETAARQANEIAASVLAPAAALHDKEAKFSTEAVGALGAAGLLGLGVDRAFGGKGLGPRALSRVVAALAEADASAAMVFLMHTLGAGVIQAAPRSQELEHVLREIAAGRHLTTLAFSEAGSRSHFWAPVSRAISLNGSGVEITAQKSFVTSAGHADSYVVSSLAPAATGPTESTLFLVVSGTPGIEAAAPWDGMGLRANASGPMKLDRCRVAPPYQLTGDGGGFAAMLNVVLPAFNLGTASVALGICRAAVAATAEHLRTARFEHMGVTLGESLPNLRAQLAQMQIQTDGLAARIDNVIERLEHPSDTTMLGVLEVKAAAAEVAIEVTSLAMRTCGGAAFSRKLGIERFFRDAHAGAVMAPTGDVLREFIGRALLGMPLF